MTVQVGDKVKFTQASSPFADARTFDATVIAVFDNGLVDLEFDFNGVTTPVHDIPEGPAEGVEYARWFKV